MLIIAILATWRLTEILTVDRISNPIRRLMPWYVWKCPRCVSVWAGIACTVAYLKYPLLNVPLALSQTYILLESLAIILNAKFLSKQQTGQSLSAVDNRKQLHVAQEPNGTLVLLKSDFKSSEVTDIFMQLVPAMKSEEKKAG